VKYDKHLQIEITIHVGGNEDKNKKSCNNNVSISFDRRITNIDDKNEEP
jgi:hypothetical protein